MGTVSFKSLDQGSEMINFKLILTTLKQALVFEEAGAVAKIASSLKMNHQKQIKLAQIRERHCTVCFRDLAKLNLQMVVRF